MFVVYAHPLETSFNGALHKQVLTTLSTSGHDVDDCDPYAESFDHLLRRQDLIDYNDTCANRQRVAPYVDHLLSADAMVLVYPVWNEGFPAILKGFLDRVFLPTTPERRACFQDKVTRVFESWRD